MFLEQRDGLVIEDGAVFDRRDAGANGGLDAVGAVRVRRDGDSVTLRLVHDRLHLFVGILLCADRTFERQHAGRRTDLDELRAVLDLVSH